MGGRKRKGRADVALHDGRRWSFVVFIVPTLSEGREAVAAGWVLETGSATAAPQVECQDSAGGGGREGGREEEGGRGEEKEYDAFGSSVFVWASTASVAGAAGAAAAAAGRRRRDKDPDPP